MKSLETGKARSTRSALELAIDRHPLIPRGLLGKEKERHCNNPHKVLLKTGVCA